MVEELGMMLADGKTSIKTTSLFTEYVFEDKIMGAGASGRIYSVQHALTGEKRALKVLKYGAKSLRELEIWSACTASGHSNILGLVDVYDNTFEADVYPHANKHWKLRRGRYLLVVMARMEGGDLFEFMVKHGGFREAAAAAIVEQLAQALAHIHSLGYVHGDLKLENVLLERAESLQVRICDFGFARHINDTPKHEYTLRYVSPEALESFEHAALTGKFLPFDVSSDVWALGVIVFVLLSGREPFPGLPQEAGYLDGRTITPHIRYAVHHGAFSLAGPAWAPVSAAAKGIVRELLTPSVCSRMTLAGLQASNWLRDACARVPCRVPH